MKLKVINSSSSGNAYALIGKDETLLLECGVGFLSIKKAINFDIAKVVGCLVTHEHLDHAKSMVDVQRGGIDVYASRGTFSKFNTIKHRTKYIASRIEVKIGGFRVLPFDVKHDAEEPLGFLINHKEMGNTLFLTDSYYSHYTFKGLNNLIIEANYSDKILEERLETGEINSIVRSRVMLSHMSLETCIDLLESNDLSDVNNIILIHLSDSNSHAEGFKKTISDLTLRPCHIATAGQTYDLSLIPF